MIGMAVYCVMSLRMAVPCELPAPVNYEPIAFHFGKATDRSLPASVRVLRAIWPETLPKPEARPERPVIVKETQISPAPVVEASLAPARRLGSIFRHTHNRVDTSCIKRRSPKLWRVMQKISRHYGKPLLVNSAYRSPSYNAALRKRSGRVAKNSLHMRCAAIDFRVAGVSVRALRRYVKSLPEVGGIGTYSSTIHIDTGPRRYW